jgi:hypothetical protein
VQQVGSVAEAEVGVMQEHCEEYARLQSEVSSILQRITELMSARLEAFQKDDRARFMTLDKELETAMGEKERAIGAAREHQR